MPDSILKKTFTLIELLVVISIIAVLAALLLPTLNNARSVAKKAKCLSNIKQIGQALIQYTNDFDDRFPQVGYVGGAIPTSAFDTNVKNVWSSNLVNLAYIPLNYKFSTTISVDTSRDKSRPFWCTSDLTEVPYVEKGKRSYAISGYVCSTNGQWVAKKISTIRNTSKSLLLGESYNKWSYFMDGSTLKYYVVRNLIDISAQHKNSANMVFIDGHADSLRPVQLDVEVYNY